MLNFAEIIVRPPKSLKIIELTRVAEIENRVTKSLGMCFSEFKKKSFEIINEIDEDIIYSFLNDQLLTEAREIKRDFNIENFKNSMKSEWIIYRMYRIMYTFMENKRDILLIYGQKYGFQSKDINEWLKNYYKTKKFPDLSKYNIKKEEQNYFYKLIEFSYKIQEVEIDFFAKLYEYILDNNLIEPLEDPNPNILKYFTNEEMKNNFRVIAMSDGRLTRSDNSNSPLNIEGIFILRENGELYILPNNDSTIHHSSHNFQDIIAAGEITTENGVIKRISNESGHYLPGLSTIKKIAEALVIMIPNTENRMQHSDAKIVMCTQKDQSRQELIKQFFKDTLLSDGKTLHYNWKNVTQHTTSSSQSI